MKKLLFLTFIITLSMTTALFSVEESSKDYFKTCSAADVQEKDCWDGDNSYYTVARAMGGNCKVAQNHAKKYADIWVEMTYPNASKADLAALSKAAKIVKVQCTRKDRRIEAQILVKYSKEGLKENLGRALEPMPDVESIEDEKLEKCEHCGEAECDCDHAKENCKECEEKNCQHHKEKKETDGTESEKELKGDSEKKTDSEKTEETEKKTDEAKEGVEKKDILYLDEDSEFFCDDEVLEEGSFEFDCFDEDEIEEI